MNQALSGAVVEKCIGGTLKKKIYWKVRCETVLFLDDMIICLGNLKNYMLLGLTGNFSSLDTISTDIT